VGILVVALLISRQATPTPTPAPDPSGTGITPQKAGPEAYPVHPVKPVLPAAGPAGVAWKLQFDEDFTAGKDALLRSGIWHTGWFGDGLLTDRVNSDEKTLFARDNLSVSGGIARLDVTPNTRHAALEDGTTQPNLGAALNTDQAQAPRGFMMTYGYAEARLQLPDAPLAEGAWPSFWLTGETWPDDMEIDIVEGDGTDSGNKFNIHYGSNHRDTTTLDDVGRDRTVPGSTAGWHTYGADIRPDGITFYYDHTAVYAYHGKVPNSARYLMVGLSSEAKVTTTRTLLVDYVRAWNRAG
jgi:hypothetical protein